MFCPYCGTKVQTREEKPIEDLGTAWSLIGDMVGVHDRDKIRDILNDVTKYLKEVNE